MPFPPERFIEDANVCGVDLVVDLGDRISDVGWPEDRTRQEHVSALFRRLNSLIATSSATTMWSTTEENEAVLGCDLAMHSMDLKGFHLIFWNANSYIPNPILLSAPCVPI